MTDDLADAWFHDDARRLGYLGPDGLGLAAYYREVVGAQSPASLEKISERREFTNWDFTNVDGQDDEC